jgi:hypothetical protein
VFRLERKERENPLRENLDNHGGVILLLQHVELLQAETASGKGEHASRSEWRNCTYSQHRKFSSIPLP